MKRRIGVLPLAVSITLVSAMAVVGLRLNASADRTGADVRRRDAVTREETLAGLVDQYLVMAAKESYDFAGTDVLTLDPDHAGDRARLEEFVSRSSFYDLGAVLVSLGREPLNAFARGPLPPASDPGYATVVQGLINKRPGVSAVMRAGGNNVVAVAVPVMRDGLPAAVLVGYWRPESSQLQTYTEKVKEDSGGRSFLLDAAGTIVTATDATLIGTKFDRSRLSGRLDTRNAGVFEVDDGAGGNTYIHAPARHGDWTLVRQVPTSKFLGAIRNGHQRSELALLGLLAVATAGMAAFSWRAERVRRRSEERFRSLVQNASDIVAVVDLTGVMTYASPAVERILGYGGAGAEPVSVLSLVHQSEKEEAERLLAEAARVPNAPLRGEIRIRRRDGSWCWFEVTLSNLLHCASVQGIVVNLRDISERKQFQEQLVHRAFHDTLTGLPNRAMFQSRLRHSLARRRAGSVKPAVLFIDLDRFKVINDSLGHGAGDELLIAVARRLEIDLREGDTLARMSGDEFTVLLEDLDDESEAVPVTERILERMRAPFTVGGREVFVGVSIGVALAKPGQQPEDVVRDADLAMYAAKQRGRHRYEIFGSDLAVRAETRLDVEDELRRAVQNEQFVVHYQPEVELTTGKVIGVEALVRWHHPVRGMVPPGQFIPLAEETGLIVPIGLWVLREACRQVSSWRNEQGVAVRLNVNLSGRQLEQGSALVNDVALVLEETGLEPQALTLELTETMLMSADAAIGTAEELRALGVELAIDDFGTGYSSLSYLKDLPVSTLKLDRSFIHGLGDDDADAAIAGAVIALAHSLGLGVTAEGVELSEQLERLETMGCDAAQGFLLYRPAAASAISEILSVAGSGGDNVPRGGVRGR